MLSQTKVREEGQRGTYFVDGRIGLGYKIGNKVYKSLGNGYYGEIKVNKFISDDGEEYIRVVSKLI